MSLLSTSPSCLIVQKNGDRVPEFTIAYLVYFYWASLLAQFYKTGNGSKILFILKESVFVFPAAHSDIFGHLNYVNIDRIKDPD